jgi:hypothetical protein
MQHCNGAIEPNLLRRTARDWKIDFTKSLVVRPGAGQDQQDPEQGRKLSLRSAKWCHGWTLRQWKLQSSGNGIAMGLDASNSFMVYLLMINRNAI